MTNETQSVWVLYAEYECGHMDGIVAAYSLEKIIEWIPDVVDEGWSNEEGMVGYYAVEMDIGVFDQLDFSFCRFDKAGNLIPETHSTRMDRK